MAVQLRDHSMTFRDVQKVAPHSLCPEHSSHLPPPAPCPGRPQEYMERLRIQKSAGVQGDRTFDFLAANVAKVERDERRQLDALQNGEQRVRIARAALLVAILTRSLIGFASLLHNSSR